MIEGHFEATFAMDFEIDEKDIGCEETEIAILKATPRLMRYQDIENFVREVKLEGINRGAYSKTDFHRDSEKNIKSQIDRYLEVKLR